MFKQRAAFIILGITVLMATWSNKADSGQKPAWKGTITTESGVKVVKNPTEPLYGTFAFELEEDLKIGGDPNNAASYFPKGGVLKVDGKGNLFLADYGNVRVQMFDKTGKFIRTIGRKGQGPGEYMFPSQVVFNAAGDTCVWDARALLVFAPDGVFRKKIAIGIFLNQFIIGPGEAIIGTTQPSPAQGNPRHILVMLDPEWKASRTIAEFKGELAQVKNVLIVHWYGNRIQFSALTAESFAYGFSDEYRIYISDRTGKTLFMLTKEEKPRPITAKEKALNEKEGIFAWMGTSGKPEPGDIKYPDHRPYFGGFFNDDVGRLYVIRDRSILEKDAPTDVDVFSKEGIYLYKMIWPAAPAAIQNGEFYELREDKDTGEYTIVRSRIKNWERMKTGAE